MHNVDNVLDLTTSYEHVDSLILPKPKSLTHISTGITTITATLLKHIYIKDF